MYSKEIFGIEVFFNITDDCNLENNCLLYICVARICDPNFSTTKIRRKSSITPTQHNQPQSVPTGMIPTHRPTPIMQRRVDDMTDDEFGPFKIRINSGVTRELNKVICSKLGRIGFIV